MEKLKDKFDKMQSVFYLVAGGPVYRVYRRVWHEGRWNEYTTYETVKVRVRRGKETYPATSEFGQYGWSFNDLASAVAKCRSLESR